MCSREIKEEYCKDNMDTWCGKLGTREFLAKLTWLCFPGKLSLLFNRESDMNGIVDVAL